MRGEQAFLSCDFFHPFHRAALPSPENCVCEKYGSPPTRRKEKGWPARPSTRRRGWIAAARKEREAEREPGKERDRDSGARICKSVARKALGLSFASIAQVLQKAPPLVAPIPATLPPPRRRPAGLGEDSLSCLAPCRQVTFSCWTFPWQGRPPPRLAVLCFVRCVFSSEVTWQSEVSTTAFEEHWLGPFKASRSSSRLRLTSTVSLACLTSRPACSPNLFHRIPVFQHPREAGAGAGTRVQLGCGFSRLVWSGPHVLFSLIVMLFRPWWWVVKCWNRTRLLDSVLLRIPFSLTCFLKFSLFSTSCV